MTATYPPSFAGDPVTYGWALFSLTALATFSLAIILDLYREAKFDGFSFSSPIGISRGITVSLLGTIFLGSIGDVLFLYAWGEVTAETMAWLLTIDRICDTLAFPVFAVFGFLFVRGRPLVAFQLLRQPIRGDLWPTWPMIRRQALSVAVILFIAWGVTVGK
jgi:hypothetical protein